MTTYLLSFTEMKSPLEMPLGMIGMRISIPGPDDEGSDGDNNREATANLLLSSDEVAVSTSEIAAEGSTNLPAASTPALQMLDDICKANFKHRIRTAITSLKEFAKGIKYDPTQQGGRSTYPLSYSF